MSMGQRFARTAPRDITVLLVSSNHSLISLSLTAQLGITVRHEQTAQTSLAVPLGPTVLYPTVGPSLIVGPARKGGTVAVKASVFLQGLVPALRDITAFLVLPFPVQ